MTPVDQILTQHQRTVRMLKGAQRAGVGKTARTRKLLETAVVEATALQMVLLVATASAREKR